MGQEITGVSFTPLNSIPTAGGPVLHLLRPGGLSPKDAGEVYFSEVASGAIKAWKLHTRMTQNMAVPMGRVRFVLYDDRPDSPTRGTLAAYELGRPDNWGFLRIPPCVWYGFAGVAQSASLVVNCPDMAHDPEESRRIPVDSNLIPYQWNSEETK